MFRLDCAGNGYDERIYRYGRASCGQLPGGHLLQAFQGRRPGRGERQYRQPAGHAGKLLRKAGMGGCGSLSGRWLHGAEHGAARPETDVKGHRAQASQPCYHERPLPAGPELLADRHADRGLLPPPRRPLYCHERRDRHPAGEQRHRALQKYPK